MGSYISGIEFNSMSEFPVFIITAKLQYFDIKIVILKHFCYLCVFKQHNR